MTTIYFNFKDFASLWVGGHPDNGACQKNKNKKVEQEKRERACLSGWNADGNSAILVWRDENAREEGNTSSAELNPLAALIKMTRGT